MESSTRLDGFRALKKTLEAPYTTKVNYRGRTSRGTTLFDIDTARPRGTMVYVQLYMKGVRPSGKWY